MQGRSTTTAKQTDGVDECTLTRKATVLNLKRRLDEAIRFYDEEQHRDRSRAAEADERERSDISVVHTTEAVKCR